MSETETVWQMSSDQASLAPFFFNRLNPLHVKVFGIWHLEPKLISLIKGVRKSIRNKGRYRLYKETSSQH